MTNEITIKTDLLAVLASFTSDDDMRPDIQGVLFRDRTAIATNGHILAAVLCGDFETASPIFVPREVCRSAIAAQDASKGKPAYNELHERRRGGRKLTIIGDDTKLRIRCGDVDVEARSRTSNFVGPDTVDGIFPKRTRGDLATFAANPKYLAAIHLLAETLGASTARVTGWDCGLSDDQVVICAYEMIGADHLARVALMGTRP